MTSKLSNSEKAKATLLAFFDNIYVVLLNLENKDPNKFNKGILNLKPSTKLNFLRRLTNSSSADDIANTYIDKVINGYIEDNKGNTINVRSLLLAKDEDFILIHIFKLLTIPKKSDIEPFIQVWTGKDIEGNVSPVKLSDRDKNIGWNYFFQLDNFVQLYYDEKNKSNK